MKTNTGIRLTCSLLFRKGVEFLNFFRNTYILHQLQEVLNGRPWIWNKSQFSCYGDCSMLLTFAVWPTYFLTQWSKSHSKENHRLRWKGNVKSQLITHGLENQNREIVSSEEEWFDITTPRALRKSCWIASTHSYLRYHILKSKVLY